MMRKKPYNTHSRGSIGNDLTGSFTNGLAFNWVDGHTINGAFSGTESWRVHGYAQSWYNLTEIRFSGSSGGMR